MLQALQPPRRRERSCGKQGWPVERLRSDRLASSPPASQIHYHHWESHFLRHVSGPEDTFGSHEDKSREGETNNETKVICTLKKPIPLGENSTLANLLMKASYVPWVQKYISHSANAMQTLLGVRTTLPASENQPQAHLCMTKRHHQKLETKVRR